jgi:hypothetical protein
MIRGLVLFKSSQFQSPDEGDYHRNHHKNYHVFNPFRRSLENLQVERLRLRPLRLVFVRSLVRYPLQDLRVKLLVSALVFEELMVPVLENEGVLLLGVGQLIEPLYLLLRLDHILGAVQHE